ncbi:hypothetical protein D3C76_1078410 [compost metagenome]
MSNQMHPEPAFVALVQAARFLELTAAVQRANPCCLAATAVDLDSIVQSLGQPLYLLLGAFVLIHSEQALDLL